MIVGSDYQTCENIWHNIEIQIQCMIRFIPITAILANEWLHNSYIRRAKVHDPRIDESLTMNCVLFINVGSHEGFFRHQNEFWDLMIWRQEYIYILFKNMFRYEGRGGGRWTESSLSFPLWLETVFVIHMVGFMLI